MLESTILPRVNRTSNESGVRSKMTAAGDKRAIVDEAGKRIRDSKTRSQELRPTGTARKPCRKTVPENRARSLFTKNRSKNAGHGNLFISGRFPCPKTGMVLGALTLKQESCPHLH